MKHQAEIIREYGPFPETEAVHGVSFDGRNIWIATGAHLSSVDPDSGRVLHVLDVAADAGTAFDGTHLFQISGAVIHRIDPASGAVLATIPAPGGTESSGLAWAEGVLWVGDYRGRAIHRIDPETGEVLRVIRCDRFVTGVTWVDGELWHGTWEGDHSDLRRVDQATGDVLDTIEMPEGTGVSGLESDGAELFFCGGGDSGRLRAVRRPTER